MDNNNEQSEIFKCFYCQEETTNKFCFSCKHYICSLCLYRRLFCYYIKEFQSNNPINIQCKCHTGSLQVTNDEVIQLMQKKTRN